MPKLIFVCTGNTCRSPMAEHLLKKMLKDNQLDSWEVFSAGIAASPGMGASQETNLVLAEKGLDISGHRSKQVNQQLLKSADLILTMTASHKQVLARMMPELKDNISTLKEYAGQADLDISDPFGQGVKTYRTTRDEIQANLERIIGRLAQIQSDAGEKKFVENIIKGSGLMKIAIGSDHAGYMLKEEVKKFLQEEGIEYQDMGTDSDQSVDYPDFAYKVAAGVAAEEFDKGILICGTGIGMSISANKVQGVRAALCHDVFSARATRNHNDANVLTMGSRIVGSGLALEIVRTWLGAEFDGGRHERRVNKITLIERGDY